MWAGRTTWGRASALLAPVMAAGLLFVIKVTTAENYEQKALYEDEGLALGKLDSLGDEAVVASR